MHTVSVGNLTPLRSDLELLEAWRGGDLPAGDELVARYWAAIARFFRSKIGDDGADLISQTFLACVEHRDAIEGDTIRAYRFGVARRRLADHFRRTARAPVVDLEQSSLAALATGPATQLSRRRRGELLREGLELIPLDDQIALELAYFEDLSVREIAGVLEINENTVRSRLSRARDKLRAALAELAPAAEAERAAAQLAKNASDLT